MPAISATSLAAVSGPQPAIATGSGAWASAMWAISRPSRLIRSPARAHSATSSAAIRARAPSIAPGRSASRFSPSRWATRRCGPSSGPSRRAAGSSGWARAARATAAASIGSDLPRSRPARRAWPISRGGTRTTAIWPDSTSARSRRPETWRTSSRATRRPSSRPSSQRTRRRWPASVARTLSWSITSPVTASMATAVWLCLCGSIPTTITAVPWFGAVMADVADRRRTGLSRGAATLLSGHAGAPRGGGGRHNACRSVPSGRHARQESAHRLPRPSRLSGGRVRSARLSLTPRYPPRLLSAHDARLPS